jgi:hypothetical protein
MKSIGKAERPYVERGHRIDADAPFAVRAALVERYHRRIDFEISC